MDLVRVFEAPDEVTAQAMASWLESNGIRTVIQPLAPSGFGGLGEELQGRWGDLLVDEAYEANAIPLIQDYLASMSVAAENGEDSPPPAA
ncbi:hypothetical protein IT575_11355 [bacterium]|nr:hypothetical protein [bacterium]